MVGFDNLSKGYKLWQTKDFYFCPEIQNKYFLDIIIVNT